MALMKWDETGDRKYQTGTDRGVLYSHNDDGSYGVATSGQTTTGYAVPWNGLTGVTQSPSGAEANPIYADNIKYLNLYSAEEFAATITAYTYPDEFAECDGSAELDHTTIPGVYVGQQRRKSFGFSYRNIIGNDVNGNDYGYEINLIYGCMASPSEKAHSTVNDSPEAVELSWELTTTPESFEGHTGYEGLKPTSIITIDSTKVDSTKLSKLEAVLYDDAAGRLPRPWEISGIMNANG